MAYESGEVYVGKSVKDFTSSDKQNAYTGVEITAGAETYKAGDESGQVLNITCPWGTPQMAQDILESIMGLQYQPYEASGAILNPAAELGDAVNIKDIYSGIYSMETTYGAMLTAKISAPPEEEVDTESTYIPADQRTVTRYYNYLTSELAIQAGEISAKVSSVGGTDDHSFGWTLTDESWVITNTGKEVLRCDKDGLSVVGEVTATSGSIGGFTIKDNYLSTNSKTYNDSKTGVYLGSNGIQLGKNFKVDTSGNLTATGGTFKGAITCTSLTVSSGTSVSIGGSSYTGSSMSSSLSGGAGWASNGSTVTANASNGNSAFYGSMSSGVSQISFGGKRYAPGTIRYVNWSGTNTSMSVLTTQD